MKKIVLSICCAALIFVTGCISSTPRNPEARLAKQVNALMQAKLDGDWLKVYTFYDQNYKSKVPVDIFKSPKKVKFLTYNIDKLSLNPTGIQARVIVRSDMVVNDFTVKDALDDQKWILEQGKWRLAAEPVIGFQ